MAKRKGSATVVLMWIVGLALLAAVGSYFGVFKIGSSSASASVVTATGSVVSNACSDARATTFQYTTNSPVNSSDYAAAVSYRIRYLTPDNMAGTLNPTSGSSAVSASITADTDIATLPCPSTFEVITLGGDNVTGRIDTVTANDPYPKIEGDAQNPASTPIHLLAMTYSDANDTQSVDGGAVSDLTTGGHQVTSVVHAMSANSVLTGKIYLIPQSQYVHGNYYTNELLISADLGSTSAFDTQSAFTLSGEGFSVSRVDPATYGITGTNVYTYKMKAITQAAALFKGARTDLLSGNQKLVYTLTANKGDPSADATISVYQPGYFVEGNVIKYGVFNTLGTQKIGGTNAVTLDLS